MKKKLLVALLAITAVVCCALGLAACEPKKVDGTEGLEYTLSDDGTYYYFSGLGTCTETDIVIANYYNNKPVKQIGRYACVTFEDLVESEVGGGEKELKECCVLADGHVKSVTVSEGITAIGVFAFIRNFQDSLESISLPKSLKTIGYGAFYGCDAIKNLTIPDGVTAIGEAAFEYCNGFESLSIPDSVTLIGASAFYYCFNLKSINIPDKVTEINKNTFNNCRSLTSIVIPDSITSIGSNAFNGCNSLTSFTYNGTKEQWYKVDINNWNDYFDYCEVKCTDGNAEKQPDKTDGSEGLEYTLSKNGKYYICSGLGTCKETDIVIASWYNNLYVTEIGERAFENGKLKSITIPDSVTTINAFAFSGCAQLTSVEIPDSVTSVGRAVFINCHNLKSAKLPKGLTVIDAMFASCYSLTDITIPDSVTKLDLAFTFCNSLKHINIPNGVTEIGMSSFLGCTSLTEIALPDSLTEIGTTAFQDCVNLKNVKIPDSVTYIGDSAFQNCSSLTEIVLSDSLIEICPNVFKDCVNLKSVIIPDSVTYIGYNIFQNCSQLTSVTIPNGVYSICEVFSGCKKLTDVYFKGTKDQWETLIYGVDTGKSNYTVHCTDGDIKM